MLSSSLPENNQTQQVTRTLSRLHAQTLLSWEQEKRLLSWYGLQADALAHRMRAKARDH